MKNLILIIATLIYFTSFAQTVNLDNASYIGFENITKGAFWSSRPEARMVYMGEYPAGVEVFTLPSDHLVDFADGNESNLTINYVRFPAGEKVYKKNGIFYAAICGNKINDMVSVNNIKVVTKTVVKVEEKEVIKYVDRPVYIQTPSQQQNQIAQVDPCNQGMAMYNQLVGQYQQTGMTYKKASADLFYLQSQYPCLQGLQILKINKTGGTLNAVGQWINTAANVTTAGATVAIATKKPTTNVVYVNNGNNHQQNLLDEYNQNLQVGHNQ